MQPDYQKVSANLSNEIASDVYTIAILQQQLASANVIINEQKLKHPEDFPADNEKGVKNGQEIQDNPKSGKEI
ncbi:hypothetical protein DS832_04855 [Bombilactobacillus bombi]|jgi:hypothetical protein|uniref:Uncharacterized protein n=1 Tax=Bombilactobacillus bombi TaxID=1303590 RepID=A0A3R6Z955_9LACO|nr:hypothetical protein [Bombilactobacillus bombi]RHW46821.1 hypothetical protein DS832_04855 [Bombilactobacillus bombi]